MARDLIVCQFSRLNVEDLEFDRFLSLHSPIPPVTEPVTHF